MKSVLLALVSATVCVADLRAGSQPKHGYKVIEKTKFECEHVIYMEPSTFNYEGLKKQRQQAYDNFLRSNIDNEQDKRNFVKEDGKDMLPFRTYESAVTDINQATIQNKIPSGAPGPVLTAQCGKQTLYPLQWNNPHASELEVNIWIVNNMYTVPIKKPVCAGEGYQQGFVGFTVPADFGKLLNDVPGFTGCNKAGDCVLQIYAHSVETRQYSIGVPIVVTCDGPIGSPTRDETKILPAQEDVGLQLDKLTLTVCRPTCDNSSDIVTAQAYKARLVSDVYNHAYQNSDYSPYSGQQVASISKNMQSACIGRMITGNRGELGRALLKKDNPEAFKLQDQIEKKWVSLVKRYEGITNKIIHKIGNSMKTSCTEVGSCSPKAAVVTQKTKECFRCGEAGACETGRDGTNTYVPSFVIPPDLVGAAKALVPKEYADLIKDNTVQIYMAVLDDMSADFKKAATLGLNYQPAMLKTTTTTMADATNFKKIDAAGKQDNGYYAAKKAMQARTAAAKAFTLPVVNTPVAMAFSTTGAFPLSEADDSEEAKDMDGLMCDQFCEDDAVMEQMLAKNPDATCEFKPDQYNCTGPIFERAMRDETPVDTAGSSSGSSSQPVDASAATGTFGLGFFALIVSFFVSML